MGLNPWELDGYTPRELDALLTYIEAKRLALKHGN